MAPKKKGAEPAAPVVNVEEVQLRIAQLSDEISGVKDRIEARAKDYADSLSTFDVPYPLTSMSMSDGVLYAGSLDKRVLGVDASAHADRFQAVAASPVCSLQVLDEPGILCAGTEAGPIECWNSLNCEPVCQLVGHTARVSQLSQGQAEWELWSCSYDGTIRRWTLNDSPQCLRMFQVCEFQLGAFVLCQKNLYAAAWDSTVRCISVDSGECTAIFKGHEHVIHAITADSAGEFLYTGSGDHMALRWSTQHLADQFEHKCCFCFKGHIDSVLCLHLLVLEEFITELSGDSASGEENLSQEDLNLLRDPCMPQQILITGSDDRSIRLFDAEIGQCLLVLIGHTDAVTGLVVENGVLYSSSFDHSIRSWQLQEALVRIQMRRTLKLLETEKLEKEELLEASTKKKKKKGKKKK